jgi:hypothetical protein
MVSDAPPGDNCSGKATQNRFTQFKGDAIKVKMHRLPGSIMVRICVLSLTVLSFFVRDVFAVDSLTPPGNGSRTLAYAANGSLGELVREVKPAGDGRGTTRLLFRERKPGAAPSAWQQVVLVGDIAGNTLAQAALFYDSGDHPLVIYLDNSGYFHELVFESGVWKEKNIWQIPGEFNGLEAGIAFTIDSSNVLHLIMLTEVFTLGPGQPLLLVYAKLSRSPEIAIWERVGGPFESKTIMDGFDFPGFENVHYILKPRNLDLAIGNDGAVHAVYSVDQILIQSPGGTEQKSSLFYSRRAPNGGWGARETVLSPGNAYGDAGIGASIAQAPDSTLALATALLPRVATGSPGVCELRYLVRQGASWNGGVILNTADDYGAGDGQRGSGLEPKLVFDTQSRPHITFTDHASEHFDGRGASSFSGQVRYATRASATSGAWSFSKLVSRGNLGPLDFQTFRPTIASRYGQVAIAATSWSWNGDTEYVPNYQIALIGQVSPPAATPAKITAQSTDVTVFSGTNVTLSVSATGTAPLTYEWFKDGTMLIGQASASLLLTNISGINAGSYYVVVKNPGGSVNSSNMVVRVIFVPRFITPPQGQHLGLGSNLTFTARTEATPPLTYQWYKSGKPLAGKTNSTLSITNAQITDGGEYVLAITNLYGSAISPPARLIIISTVPKVIVPPQTTADTVMWSVLGEPERSYAIQVSTNLMTWADFETIVPNTSLFEIRESNYRSWPRRFFRVLIGASKPVALPSRSLLVKYSSGLTEGDYNYVLSENGNFNSIELGAGLYLYSSTAEGLQLRFDYNDYPGDWDLLQLTFDAGSKTTGQFKGTARVEGVVSNVQGEFQFH